MGKQLNRFPDDQCQTCLWALDVPAGMRKVFQQRFTDQCSHWEHQLANTTGWKQPATVEAAEISVSVWLQ